MTAAAHEIIEAGRVQADMSHEELWWAYFALGGDAGPAVVRCYLGGLTTEPIEYDMLAHAINERFVERGGNHPVPYLDDLAGRL
jgi:hypothetical protein